MPRAAIATGAVDYVLPLWDIASMLVHLRSGEPNADETNKEAV